MIKNFLPFFIFLFISCNFFNANQPDYWDNMYDEVAWAKAARLEVTVALPSAWGNSP